MSDWVNVPRDESWTREDALGHCRAAIDRALSLYDDETSVRDVARHEFHIETAAMWAGVARRASLEEGT